MHVSSPLPPVLHLYNSRTRQKEIFTPLNPEKVGMYFCGPTVYDRVHLGNLRAMLTGDILFRLLKVLYPQVTYVRNITDIDDKIIKAAAENRETTGTLTARTIEQFHKDCAALNLLPPTYEPKATDYIPQMLDMIKRLLQSGHAYEANGHVLFSVESDPHYGELSGRRPEDLKHGARVEIGEYKKHPGDFVLWKPSNPEEPGWDSPYGRGRPGWHLECSAMSEALLGKSFDIHGGGGDLLFPHHENERAQSTCCNPKTEFARYWLHTGMLTVNGEKMSKSLGNFITIEEALKVAPGEALRLLFLSTHYRSPLDFTWEKLKEAKKTLDRFYRAFKQAGILVPLDEMGIYKPEDSPVDQQSGNRETRGCLCADLNTPLLLAKMHSWADVALQDISVKISPTGRRYPHEKAKEAAPKIAQAVYNLKLAGRLMGLFSMTPEEWFRGGNPDGPQTDWIEEKIAERQAAKQKRDFPKADAIRNELAEKGVLLEDGPDGTRWRRA